MITAYRGATIRRVVGLLGASAILLAGTIPAVFAESGATLSLLPSASEVAVQEEFSVDVLLDTAQSSVNVVAAEMLFDIDRLELLGIDGSYSAFPGAVEAAAVGNAISITRYVLPSALSGSALNVSRLRFRARNTGTAALTFAFAGDAGPTLAMRAAQSARSILASVSNATVNIRGAADNSGAVRAVSFGRDLAPGLSGEDVRRLQEYLRDNGSYPEGIITGYFGPLTKAAVIRFQEKYRAEILVPRGLSAGTGYVGPSTRAKLNALLSAE